MPVRLHRQGTAILMAKPTSYRENVYPRLDTGSSKQMAKIMVGNTLHTNHLGCPIHRFLAFPDNHDVVIGLGVRPFRLQPTKEITHLRQEWDGTRFPVLCAVQGITVNL